MVTRPCSSCSVIGRLLRLATQALSRSKSVWGPGPADSDCLCHDCGAVAGSVAPAGPLAPTTVGLKGSQRAAGTETTASEPQAEVRPLWHCQCDTAQASVRVPFVRDGFELVLGELEPPLTLPFPPVVPVTVSLCDESWGS